MTAKSNLWYCSKQASITTLDSAKLMVSPISKMAAAMFKWC